MSEALYERYKEALRRGHVAAQRGRHDVALDAYGEASRLAPDRALPYVGIADVLARRGRQADALAAYDTALERAPTDEAALRGRAELLAASGDRAGSARAFDRLAAGLDAAGRLADANEAARRALDLAESRGRRDTAKQLAERLRAVQGQAPADVSVVSDERTTGPGPVSVEPARDETGVGSPMSAIEDAVGSILPAPEVAAAEVLDPEVIRPPFEPAPATARVEEAAEAGDRAATVALALVASAGHRANGATAAAIDACYIALAADPSDPDLHLELVEIYLDRGWRPTAADKLVLLARLADLADDGATRERVCAVASARLSDDARLAAICA